MTKEISRLNILITEFLQFVRPEERKLDVCSIDQILSEVLDMAKLNSGLSQNVEQIRNLQSRAYVAGDKNKLKQVFLNLVINAYQAMVDVGRGRLEVKSYVQETGSESWVIVRVADNGHGMSESTLKRLFEPFFTTKQKGTGLGLATAHKILEIHEAKIFVESHEGQGTEFTIQFHQAIKQGARHHESQDTGS